MSYQAIYDAAFAQFDLSWQKDLLVQDIACAVDAIRNEHIRPSVLMRPSLTLDGNQWCCLYGDNLQDGVAGFGDTPAQATEAFDAAWVSAPMLTTALDDAQPALREAAEGLMGLTAKVPA